eukprot:TRINITY_DN33748_c0_g1_i1.p1 TRINITY_DN33748_c0_g1~~TRINITY_DN33748_c0_g1_i1.p1  ORF type:complete len:795 (+),score=220.71 TRINITY_DN33748_c0_g1_i1:62-2446(+)
MGAASSQEDDGEEMLAAIGGAAELPQTDAELQAAAAAAFSRSVPAPHLSQNEGVMRQVAMSEEQRTREDFARLWEQYVPGGSRTSTVSRPLMREVLLRAMRELALLPQQGAGAEELVSRALGSAPPALAAEDAFEIFRSVMQRLRASRPAQSSEQFHVVLPRDVKSAYPNPVTSSYAKMPKGARVVDRTPAQKYQGDGAAACSQAKLKSGDPAHPSNMSAKDRPTRAAQESAHASIRAALGASQAIYEQLLNKAESLRESLVLGRFDGPIASDDLSDRRFSSQSQRMQLEGEVERLSDRLRAHANVIEQQKKEMAALHEDCMLQAQRAQASMRRLSETKEKLDDTQQESYELARQAKTEQLRAVMLREAFEQEQNRVGVSLSQAEACVSDLVAATEGTRRIEVEEQSVARECIAALNEIQEAQAREELAAEAKLTQLMRELQAAKAALTEAAPTMSQRQQEQSAQAARLETERSAALAELTELRRRNHGVAAVMRRRAADVQVFRREMQALQQRNEQVLHELQAPHGKDSKAGKSGSKRSTSVTGSGTMGSLLTRLQLEEAAEAALQLSEARLQGELADAQVGIFVEETSMGGRERRLFDLAKRYTADLQAELEQVRSELSTVRSQAVPGGNPGPGSASDDLVAAGLQRRVGMAMAAERESHCRLKEEQLRKHLAEEELKVLRGRLARLDGSVQEVHTPEQLACTPSQPATPQIGPSAAVAAADLQHAPAVATAKLQARLAALRGSLPNGQGSPIAEQKIGDEMSSLAANNLSLQSQLQALREQLNGKAGAAES